MYACLSKQTQPVIMSGIARVSWVSGNDVSGRPSNWKNDTVDS